MLVGLGTLRDIILKKPGYRLTALENLLTYASHSSTLPPFLFLTSSDPDIRTPTVRFITNKLLRMPDPRVQREITGTATGLLESLAFLSEIKTEEGAAPTQAAIEGLEKEISRKTHLFFSLCSKQHDMLQG